MPSGESPLSPGLLSKNGSDTTPATSPSTDPHLSATDEYDIVTEEDDVLKSLSSIEGEELLAFFDDLRSTYSLDTADLDLPQLVVVGSTSCGKSSLLQAITKLPFPVDSGICTLFATETKIHRCKPSERPYYTITMEGRTQSSLLTPREYYGDSWLDVSQRLQEDLKDAFDSVSPKSTDKGDENAVGHSAIQRMRRIRQRVQLTEDVMRVDVYKPDQAHFSVVDIPGLVSGGSGEDQMISEKLARHYIRNPRAIILAVMPAVDDIHNQGVLRLIQEEDAMNRTIGVITKCDMLQRRDEHKILELLTNRRPEYRLDLGWFAVRNRTTEELEKEVSLRERDAKEVDFFRAKIWRGVSDFVGVEQLRACLSKTLYRHVKETFPGVQADIKHKLDAYKKELNTLGESRDSFRLQQVYLDDIQRNHEKLAHQWLTGIYREDCADKDASKLRAHLNELEEEFERIVQTQGTEYEFVLEQQGGRVLQTVDYENFPSSWEERMTAGGGIFAWILKTWNNNRGDGLWYKPPTDLEERLWRVQIRSWGPHARAYLARAIQKILDCCDVLYEAACPDLTIRKKIRHALDESLQGAIMRAEDDLDTIVQELGRMKTCHRGFKEKLEKVQRELIGNSVIQEITDNKLRNILSIHENLREFWRIALSRFVDNIIIQVVERHLLGPKGLIFSFNVDWIRSLSEKQLEHLVGEDSTIRKRRETLHAQVCGLEQALNDSDEMLHL